MTFCLFKANFLHLKDLEKTVNEPSDFIGNEPTPDIHIEDSRQDIKIQKDTYMSFEMNILIMYHVHHISTEKDGKCLIVHLIY